MADKLHIPIREGAALKLLGQVRPNADMPRPGAQPSTQKPKRKGSKKRTS